MSYLLFYPMIHVPSRKYLEKVMQRSNSIRGKGSEITPDLEKVITNDMEIIDATWNMFTEYLKEQEPFDKVYFESISEMMNSETVNIGFEDGAMRQCLKYLKNSTVTFEKTESELLHKIGWKLKEYEIPFVLANLAREIYVLNRISKNLKEDDRGVLLMGSSHSKRVVEHFQSKPGLEFELYHNHLAYLLENPTTGLDI